MQLTAALLSTISMEVAVRSQFFQVFSTTIVWYLQHHQFLWKSVAQGYCSAYTDGGGWLGHINYDQHKTTWVVGTKGPWHL